MYCIISNYGNDSIALIQWAIQQELNDVYVIYVDTGWAAPGWLARVEQGEAWVKRCGFTPVHLNPNLQFAELIQDRNEFPSQKFQWCAGILKGLPILTWLDELDPGCEACILLALNPGATQRAIYTPEFIEESEYYGERRVWHPLFKHCLVELNQLIKQTNFELLPHRSLECDPCVNSQIADFKRFEPETIAKLAKLEQKIDKIQFAPPGCPEPKTIESVVSWAKTQADAPSDTYIFDMGCGSPYGCGQ